MISRLIFVTAILAVGASFSSCREDNSGSSKDDEGRMEEEIRTLTNSITSKQTELELISAAQAEILNNEVIATAKELALDSVEIPEAVARSFAMQFIPDSVDAAAFFDVVFSEAVDNVSETEVGTRSVAVFVSIIEGLTQVDDRTTVAVAVGSMFGVRHSPAVIDDLTPELTLLDESISALLLMTDGSQDLIPFCIEGLVKGVFTETTSLDPILVSGGLTTVLTSGLLANDFTAEEIRLKGVVLSENLIAGFSATSDTIEQDLMGSVSQETASAITPLLLPKVEEEFRPEFMAQLPDLFFIKAFREEYDPAELFRLILSGFASGVVSAYETDDTINVTSAMLGLSEGASLKIVLSKGVETTEAELTSAMLRGIFPHAHTVLSATELVKICNSLFFDAIDLEIENPSALYTSLLNTGKSLINDVEKRTAFQVAMEKALASIDDCPRIEGFDDESGKFTCATN